MAPPLSLQNLFFCLVGCLLGTLIGVLPGIGPVATIAMLLPVTYGLSPLAALIMLAGIYYGAQYGGSTTAILVNMPGEISSVVTCLDGYQMARQGRAGPALAVAALGSFFAGCVGTLVVAGFAPILAAFSQKFTSVEYFSLMVLGLLSAVVLAHGSDPEGDRDDLRSACSSAWPAPTSTPAPPDTPSGCPSCSTASACCRWRWACSGSTRSWSTWSGPRRASS